VWRTAYGVCVLAEYDVESIQALAGKAGDAVAVQREVRVVEASLVDKISGTGNRESLDQAIATEISRVRRTGLPLTAFMTAIDSFDALSVEKSLPSGRKLIARFGYLLRLLTRPTDVAARFEGDEFVVLLPHTKLEQGAIVARRIGAAIANEPNEPRLSASFGMTELQVDEDAGSFLRRLQATFERARQSGAIVGL
jgi:diguanylate cyclase (GGDEF)-like protein